MNRASHSAVVYLLPAMTRDESDISTQREPQPTSRHDGPRPRAFIALALLVIAIVPLLPVLFSPKYPATHESFRYEELTMLFKDSIAHGHLYPRWLPDLAGGHGYPTFVFYQPLVFYVGSLVSLLPVAASKWMFGVDYVFFVVGVSGAYRLARIDLPHIASLAASGLFILTPYVFVNLNIRADHSELASMMLLPWPLWAMIAMKQRFEARRPLMGVAAVGAVSLALLLCAHPATAMVAVPLLGAICALQCLSIRREARGRWILVSGCVCALALALASPYWLCVWQCRPFVHLDRISQSYFRAELHTVPVSRLLSNTWSFGVSAGSLGQASEMSLPIGSAHLLMAIAGAIIGRRNGWIRAAAVAYVLLILAILPVSAKFWEISSNPLRTIQFPWRLLAVLAPIQLLLILPLLRRFQQAWAPVVIIALVAGWQWQMFRVSPQPHRIDDRLVELSWREADEQIRGEVAALRESTTTFAGMNEFDPMWMRVPPEPRGNRPLITSLDKVEYLSDHSNYLISARITTARESGVLLEQLYFPGWQVEVNGNDIADEELRAATTDDGRMLIPVSAGTSTIRAWYAGPPLGAVRLSLAAMAALGAAGWLWRLDRRKLIDVS